MKSSIVGILSNEVVDLKEELNLSADGPNCYEPCPTSVP